MNPSIEPRCQSEPRSLGHAPAPVTEGASAAECTGEDLGALLAECRFALDDLLQKKPMFSSMVCGSTSLGNLRAMLHQFRGKAGPPQSTG